MNVLLILNDPPYGTERSYNGLRLAGALAKRDGVDVRIFLMGDAVGCAATGQKVPDGYYHLDRMITSAAHHGAEVGCCATCLDARGLDDDHLIESAHRATLDELTDWTLWADQVATF
jgi:uncharacterized protein involved in oxidation of intracellular sulfur